MVESGLLDWKSYDFQTGSFYSIGESKVVEELPNIDNSLSGKPYISTSVDCYCSGVYMTKIGSPKTIEIKKRFSINVRYANSTLTKTIQEVRNEVQREFKRQFPKFTINAIFVPELVPQVPVNPIMFQSGSRLYRELMEAGRYQALLKLRQKIHIKYIKDMYNIDQLIVGKFRKK